MFNGLKIYGEPLKGHIPLGANINNKKDWARAIFVSPSIFYASQYSEIIYSDNEEWFIIIDARLNPNSYELTKH